MQIGITQQPEISQKVLELIDFIELRVIDPVIIKQFSCYQKPLLFHLQDFYQRQLAFIADDDLVGLMKDLVIQKILHSSAFPWFSFHLGSPVETYTLDSNQDFVGTSPPLSRQKLFDKTSTNLQAIQKLYPQFQILLENRPFMPPSIAQGANDYICEPTFINEVIRQNHCYFLFDFGHAVVSAYNLGYKNPSDYFDLLPLDKIIEIHLHHPRRQENYWADAHLPFTAADLASLKLILKKAPQVQVLTLEAQGLHPESVLLEELRQLKIILKSYSFGFSTI